MRSRFLFAAVFVFLAAFCSLPVLAQGRNSTGTGGIHEIRGRIYMPNGKSFDSPIEVELQSTNFGSLKVYCDRNGGYSFQALAPGNYTVIVNAGDAFEVAREYITIDVEVQTVVRVVPTPKVSTLPIYLQFKRGAAPLKNEVVNARWAQVPRAAISRYQNGLELVKENKITEATAEFKKAIELYPSFAPPHAALGKLSLLAGKLDEAAAEFRMAVTYDPTDAEAQLNYGVCLLNMREFPQAQKELTKAAELSPSAVTPRYYLGLLFIQKNDLDAAQKEMELAKVLKGDKNFPLLHRYLGGIYMAKHLNKQAVTELEAYVQQDPNAKDAGRIRQTISELKTQQN